MNQFNRLPRTQIIPGRACKNCTGPIPKLSNKGGALKRKTFCCDNCRKEFHKNNGISVHRLKEQVQKWVAEACVPMQRSIDILALRLNALDLKPEVLNRRANR